MCYFQPFDGSNALGKLTLQIERRLRNGNLPNHCEVQVFLTDSSLQASEVLSANHNCEIDKYRLGDSRVDGRECNSLVAGTINASEARFQCCSIIHSEH